VGCRLKGQYVRATIYTKTPQLRIYYQGQLIKTFGYQLPGDKFFAAPLAEQPGITWHSFVIRLCQASFVTSQLLST
jgi:hypothetical protein